MSSIRLLLSLFVLACLGSVSVHAQSKLVTGGSVGPIKIGMKVSEMKKIMPGHKFERTSDGEGISLILVSKGGKSLMTIYDGDDGTGENVDKDNVIQQITVWSPEYKTKGGIGPGSKIADTEKIYGKLKEIMMSEIESREYAQFQKMPKGLDFRVQGAGVYPKGSRKTTMYRKGAEISALVASGDGTEDNVGYFSDYTDLGTACKAQPSSEGGHTLSICEAPGNYRVHMFDTAKSYEIQVRSGLTRQFVSLASEALSWSPKNKKIEWRFKFGEPFAVIFRTNEYAKDDDGTIKYPAKVTGQYLVVKGLPGFSSIKGRVNAKNKNANVLAREIADKGYAAIQREKNEKAFLEIDTGDYNIMIIQAKSKGETWVKSPMQTALKIVSEFTEMKSRTMKFEAPTGDGFTSFKLTVINDGFLDDSVAGDKYEFSFQWEDESWRMNSARRMWKCWPGRGHQDYSAVPCN